MKKYTFKQARKDYPLFFKNSVGYTCSDHESRIVSSLYKNRCFIEEIKRTDDDTLYVVWYVPPIESNNGYSVRLVDARGHKTLSEAKAVARRGFDPNSKHAF